MNVFTMEEPQPQNFEISAPYNFKHTTHVQADPHSSTGFSVRRDPYPFPTLHIDLTFYEIVLGSSFTHETSVKSFRNYKRRN